ncbi:alpha/beta hydrolase [Caulobacter sp. NIBR1757]|uniref:alpha/beta fold hydrolase n=1 Tax=Caulobacter sp. NIBR1757 TaxID=3016000 RepID=UPI0022F0478E|nr:alpha/beta hydrolase [Caulobacter sp. NIBR1757]WGM39155.1 Putative aminoacrylate hydrolase RutD [Caulobacter sp. NIBR1757]
MLLKTMRLLTVILAFLAPGLAHAAQPTRFTVEVRGKGPDVILIPGLASSRAVWEPTAKALEGRYRLHIVQVNGFAGSPAGANAQGPIVDGMVEELAAYVADNKLDRPAVIGHSMGGFTGLALARRHPESLGRLMVVDAFPFFSILIQAKDAAAAEPVAARTRANFATLSDEDLLKVQTRTMKTLVKNEQGQKDAVAWSMASDRQVVGQVTYEVMTSDLRGELAAITTPVTVLYAKDASMGFVGAIIGGVYKDNYAALKGVKVIEIDNSLHFIMLDQPEAFLGEVETFLK